MDDIRVAIQAMGVSVGPNQQFEPLDFDSENVILGPDITLQEPERGYVPRDILSNRTVKRDLSLGPHGTLSTRVPTAGALLFMKLKAYHDRELSWRAFREPAVMAQIPAHDRGNILGKTYQYYERKASKDLYDMAFLAAHHRVVPEARTMAAETGLAADLLPLLERRPPIP
ncbi:MAG: hypothetical protein ACYDDF_10350 [Thermoplasmatota archaeon]